MKQQPKPDRKKRRDSTTSAPPLPSETERPFPRRPHPGSDRTSHHQSLPVSETATRRDIPENGVQVTSFHTPVAGPPTLMVVENDGRPVMEEQSLVGWVSASYDRKSVLELYGIDMRYAIHNPRTDRWERCLFSCPLADMLEMLAAEDEFPFAFEATPSQAEVDWAHLRTHGQKSRPMFPLKFCLIVATPESLAAVANDDQMRIRRGSPKAGSRSGSDGPESSEISNGDSGSGNPGTGGAGQQ